MFFKGILYYFIKLIDLGKRSLFVSSVAVNKTYGKEISERTLYKKTCCMPRSILIFVLLLTHISVTIC